MMRDIFELVDATSEAFTFLLKDISHLLTDKNAKRTWKYLVSRGLICEFEDGSGALTDVAKLNLLADIVKQRNPDGKKRLITFDIPEKLRNRRDILRTHLKELGFSQWQKSVWISEFPCGDLVELVFRIHGVRKYARLFVGDVWDAKSNEEKGVVA